MQNFSSVVLLGHLGDHPKITLYEDTKFASMRLAINCIWKKEDKQYGATHWINVVAQNRLAEVAERYVHKGDPLLVRGELRTREWVHPEDGKKRYETYVVAREIKLLKSHESTDALSPELLDESSSMELDSV